MDDPDPEPAAKRRKRADAVRNREQILRATIDLVVEGGVGVPMDAIAKRAGVGIATLYRHFPDRTSLFTQVQLDVLHRAAEEAEAAAREETDAFAALARYMHAAVDLRASIIMPLLNDRVIENERLLAARRRGRQAFDALVTNAHAQQALRPEVSNGDIAMLIIRVSRPIQGLTPEDNFDLSHRHLELVLDGFLPILGANPLPGPTLTIDELTP